MNKFINKTFKLAPFCLGLLCLVFSCSDIEDDTFFAEGGSVLFFENIAPGFYDLGDLSNTFVGFDVDFGGEPVSQVVVTKSLNGGPSVDHSSGPIPGPFSITLDEAVDGLGVTAEDIQIGDVITFTVTAGPSSRSINFVGSCSSTLAGSYAFTTASYFCDDVGPLSDTITITEDAAGLYSIDDWSFGSYQQCYNGPAASWGTLQFTDVCNRIAIIGADNYGDTWTFNIGEINGDQLTLSFENTYGEFATTVLTNPNGDWPPLFN